MLNAIWRFLVYRLAGGRILIAITVLNWLRRRIAARRIAANGVGRRGNPDASIRDTPARAPRSTLGVALDVAAVVRIDGRILGMPLEMRPEERAPRGDREAFRARVRDDVAHEG
jgi:hypothetical protein